MSPKDPLSEARMTAETSDPNRCDMPISEAERGSSLTLRQVQVLRCVEQWVDARGWPPSLSELCVMLGTPSKAVVVEHLKALERKGFLRRDAGERRGLRVLIPSRDARVVESRPLKKATHLCDRCKREVG